MNASLDLSKVVSSAQQAQAASSGVVAKPGANERDNCFHLFVTGQVEAGQFDGLDNLYCRYSFSFGPDWRPVHGVDTGLSQIAQKANGGDTKVVWNFPLDISFSSTNAFGWPRLVLSVYGVDAIGRSVVRGYGCVHVPTAAGCYTRYVRLFRPVSSSVIQQLYGWLWGTRPEFFEDAFVGQAEGREVTRVASGGVVKVKINVMTKGMAQHGYSEAITRGTAV
jgi:B9 domain-containing protein 1